MTAFNDLPRLAQLNVEWTPGPKPAYVHCLIAAFLPPHLAAPLCYEGWQCILKGSKITSDLAKATRLAVFGHKLRLHLHDRKILSSTAFGDVDWAALEAATDTFPPLYHLWMSKHVSGFFGTSQMMENWGFWDNQQCPCFHHIKEDKVHLLLCPAESSASRWKESVHGMDELLVEMDTAFAIRQCIIRALSARRLDHSFKVGCADQAWLAASAQNRIRWMNFTEGKIARQWHTIQAAHYQAIASRRSTNKWAAGLVTCLLSLVHSQWTHRCSVLHARDADGLRLKDGQELHTASSLQFQMGLEGLHQRDHQLLLRGMDSVLIPENCLGCPASALHGKPSWHRRHRRWKVSARLC
jgi:hypothetical protein